MMVQQQMSEMLPEELDDLNLVINSISEGGPTPREAREHRE